MTTPTISLVCGCIRGVPHWPTCTLGRAEEIAVDAALHFPAVPGVKSRLIVALVELERAGLLTDPSADNLREDVECLMDLLWEMGRIPLPATVDGAA